MAATNCVMFTRIAFDRRGPCKKIFLKAGSTSVTRSPLVERCRRADATRRAVYLDKCRFSTDVNGRRSSNQSVHSAKSGWWSRENEL